MTAKLSLVSKQKESRRLGELAFPEHTMEALDNYFLKGYPPGGFLTSILTNNLYGAVSSADNANKHVIFEIVKWLTTESRLPPTSWGCNENVIAWLHDEGGIRTKWVEKMEKEYIWETLKA
jgi:hypothetical protein